MTIITLLISLIIWGLIFWLLWWALGAVGIPEPFHKAAVVLLVVAAVVVILGICFGNIAPFPFINNLILK